MALFSFELGPPHIDGWASGGSTQEITPNTGRCAVGECTPADAAPLLAVQSDIRSCGRPCSCHAHRHGHVGRARASCASIARPWCGRGKCSISQAGTTPMCVCAPEIPSCGPLQGISPPHPHDSASRSGVCSPSPPAYTSSRACQCRSPPLYK